VPADIAIESERAVLGAILLEPAALHAATEILAATDYHLEAHRLIWSAILDLQQKDAAIDMLTVRAELLRTERMEAAGGPVYLAQLTNGIPRGTNVHHYAAPVKDASLRRSISSLSYNAQQQVQDPGEPTAAIIEALQLELLKLGSAGRARGWRTAADLVAEAYTEIEAIAQRKTDVLGISTGFRDIDRLTQGLKRGELIVVAGRPGHGKTSWAANTIANAILRHGSRVGMFTIEMSATEIIKRLLYSEARVDSYRVGGGYLKAEDWSRLSVAAGDIGQTHLWVDDIAGVTIASVRAQAQRLAIEHGLDMIVIDYLQLMTGSGRRGESREREIADISRGLKLLAKDLRIPVVLVSQLNRQVEIHNRKPMLSDLRESGAIEQDADVVLFVWRDELIKPTDDNRGRAEIIIGKQRNGPVGMSVQLAFLKQFTKFTDYQPEAAEPKLWYQET